MTEQANLNAIELTGHPGIDAQHQELAGLIARLDDICVDDVVNRPDCALCPELSREVCIGRLADLIGELLGFMVEHFRYEEQLMRLLTPSPEAMRHIHAHKRAHAEVSEQLSALTFGLDGGDPRACAQRLQNIIEAWMGGHSQTHDSHLAGALEAAFGHEVDYDQELVRLMAEAA